MDKITRHFTVVRHGTEMIYDFTTDMRIFEKMENENIAKLYNYLRTCFMDGYPEREGKESVSSMSALYRQKKKQDHYLTHLIELANYKGYGKYQHEIVQSYLHKYDKNILATEVPVWDDTCHGFIDVLRVLDNGTIEIFDFKPNAREEKKAHSQVYRYGNLLSLRTGIPRSNIITSYGDEINYYVVE